MGVLMGSYDTPTNKHEDNALKKAQEERSSAPREKTPINDERVERAEEVVQEKRNTIPEVHREVIREDDLSIEDRLVLNADNRIEATEVSQSRMRDVPTASSETPSKTEEHPVQVSPLANSAQYEKSLEQIEVAHEHEASLPTTAYMKVKSVNSQHAEIRGSETIEHREYPNPGNTPDRRGAAQAKPLTRNHGQQDKVSSAGPNSSTKKQDQAEEGSGVDVDINMIAPNPNQPRTNFDKDELEELTASIKKDGLLQPILVRKIEDGTYQIIAGERRWQASKRAGLKKVPIRVVDADDDKVLELALVENLQRSDLNPIEEAYGYKRMMERTHKTQSEVAAAVSKGRSTIANALRLLDLPEEAQELLFDNKISAGHARAILSIPSDEGRKKLTEKLKEGNLSVRETESLAKLMAGRDKTTLHTRKPAPPAIYKSAAYSLSSLYGTKVRIKSTSSGKNKIEVEFKDENDLKRILAMMEPEQEEE